MFYHSITGIQSPSDYGDDEELDLSKINFKPMRPEDKYDDDGQSHQKEITSQVTISDGSGKKIYGDAHVNHYRHIIKQVISNDPQPRIPNIEEIEPSWGRREDAQKDHVFLSTQRTYTKKQLIELANEEMLQAGVRLSMEKDGLYMTKARDSNKWSLTYKVDPNDEDVQDLILRHRSYLESFGKQSRVTHQQNKYDNSVSKIDALTQKIEQMQAKLLDLMKYSTAMKVILESCIQVARQDEQRQLDLDEIRAAENELKKRRKLMSAGLVVSEVEDIMKHRRTRDRNYDEEE